MQYLSSSYEAFDVSPSYIIHAAKIHHIENFKLLTVAVLILDDHVVILSPGRVIANYMWVVTQHCMGIDLPHCQLPEGPETFR